MSDLGDLHDDSSRDAAAAEYVLGTLNDTDRAAFEQALKNESAASGHGADANDVPLRAAVYAWQDRLLGLAAAAMPVVPEAGVWVRIDETVSGPAGARAGAAGAASDLASSHVNAPRILPLSTGRRTDTGPRVDRGPWFERLRFWQGAGAFAIAAAVWMAVLLVERPASDANPGERYLALLQSPSTQSTGWVVEIEAGHQLQLIPIASGDAVPAGKALQFWTKPQGAAAPTSLGLVAAGRSIQLPVARLPGVGASQLFEITLEPSAGSPIGKPTGPILYVGRTIHL